MIESKKVNKILYGGDYNPEQWPEEIWAEDMRLFKKAGINTVTLNVFSWAALQPSEDVYDFEKLDRIVDTVTEAGLNIIMATSTGARPALADTPDARGNRSFLLLAKPMSCRCCQLSLRHTLHS